jgi:transcriptional antiterminator RfaH
VSESYQGGIPQWFALSVKPRFDKAVTAALESKGFEAFLALRTQRNIYGVRCREVELPIFPGYVFCRFDVLSRLPILTTPGVLQVLGVGQRPMPVPDDEIVSLKTAIDARIGLQAFPFPPIGQQVCIRHGALAGVQGTVVNLKHSRKIVLSVSLLQRSVLLEVDYDKVDVMSSSNTELHSKTASVLS